MNPGCNQQPGFGCSPETAEKEVSWGSVPTVYHFSAVSGNTNPQQLSAGGSIPPVGAGTSPIPWEPAGDGWPAFISLTGLDTGAARFAPQKLFGSPCKSDPLDVRRKASA